MTAACTDAATHAAKPRQTKNRLMITVLRRSNGRTHEHPCPLVSGPAPQVQTVLQRAEIIVKVSNQLAVRRANTLRTGTPVPDGANDDEAARAAGKARESRDRDARHQHQGRS